MSDREAMKLALKALDTLVSPVGSIYAQARKALRARLAAPSLAVTVDPRLTPDEASAISSALAALDEDIEALRRDAEKWRKSRAKYIAWQKGGKAEAMEDKT